MKLTDLVKLNEKSSKDINDDILNHNVKATFGETTKEVQDNPYEGNKAKIDHTAGKKPPKKQRGNDRLLFTEGHDVAARAAIFALIKRSDEIVADKSNYPLDPATKWVVVDNQTQQPVSGIYTKLSRARARVDKLDLQYGGIRYKVKPLYEPKQVEVD
jgi:hypothetical protein